MIRNRIFGLHVGLRSGVFAGAALVAVGVSPVHAQSGEPISPPANTAGPPASTASSDHVRQATEPPPFDANKPASRAARAKAPAPVAPDKPSAATAQPRPPATAVDPWAEPATAPAPETRSTTRRRAEAPKVIGIDSLGHSSEEASPEARPQRNAGAAPAETTDERLPR
jgi:hypothetical protein